MQHQDGSHNDRPNGPENTTGAHEKRMLKGSQVAWEGKTVKGRSRRTTIELSRRQMLVFEFGETRRV